jgi:hypothetical protein
MDCCMSAAVVSSWVVFDAAVEGWNYPQAFVSTSSPDESSEIDGQRPQRSSFTGRSIR